MQIDFIDQDSETKELLDLKSTFNVFKNGFSEAMHNILQK